MPARTEVSAVPAPVRPVNTVASIFPRRVARLRLAHLAAGLLGAVTAVGMTVLLLVGAFAAALLVSRVQDTSPGALASGLASDAAPVSVIGALLLSVIVVTAFACGGYVAARLAGDGARGQALAVWTWAVLLPVLLGLAALLSAARDVVTELRPNGAAALLLATLATMALLGALLGGETGRLSLRTQAGE